MNNSLEEEKIMIRETHQAKVQVAKGNLEYDIRKLEKDYEILISDYEAERDARLDALESFHNGKKED